MNDATQPRMARGRMLSAGILAAALFALLAFAPIASATPDPVGSGSTKVVLNNQWNKYLKTFGIKVQKIKPSKQKGKNQFIFNAEEGSMDPTNGFGEVSLEGGLKFKAGKKTAPVKAMVLDTNKMKLIAKVGGKKVTFATLKGLSYSRNGFGVNVKLNKMKLTNAAANLLNKKTGYKKGKPKPFLKNKLIAKSWSQVQPSEVAVIAQGAATLNLSAQSVEKLAKVGPETFPTEPGVDHPFQVHLAPIAPTQVVSVSPLTAAFPISGGEIGPTAEAGTLMTAGGLLLTQNLEAPLVEKGVTTLEMGNIWIDLGAKTASVEVTIKNSKDPTVGGALGRASIADFVLTGVATDPVNRTVAVSASATLQAVTAATLNQVFIEPLEKSFGPDDVKFEAGDSLGSFAFTAQTQ
jgi:hypothetical protein